MNYDRGAKFEFYRSIPSLKEYAVIDSRKYYAELWRKTEGRWVLANEWKNKDGDIYFESIGQTVSLQDIYYNTEEFLSGS